MRRNILAYKAPPNNEGYDLICIHPDPRVKSRAIRVQVKSRYATDCDRGFPVKKKTFGAFDYLIVVFMNIGHFGRRTSGPDAIRPPEFYTLPRRFIEEHHDASSSWEKVRLRGLRDLLELYKDENGFELIAHALRIARPARIG